MVRNLDTSCFSGRRLWSAAKCPAVRVPLLSCRMWSGSPRGRTKARHCQHAPSPSRPYTPTSAVQICRGRCSSDKRFGGKKLIQPWSSPRRRTSSITPAAVQDVIGIVIQKKGNRD
uniref:Uncharacterized protein n=1 Tax=Triticum urartu TaxID=4572 RepID=A0A8R7QB22_TRIUA